MSARNAKRKLKEALRWMRRRVKGRRWEEGWARVWLWKNKEQRRRWECKGNPRETEGVLSPSSFIFTHRRRSSRRRTFFYFSSFSFLPVLSFFFYMYLIFVFLYIDVYIVNLFNIVWQQVLEEIFTRSTLKKNVWGWIHHVVVAISDERGCRIVRFDSSENAETIIPPQISWNWFILPFLIP